MPPLDLLGTFQDPLNLDQGAGKLVNVRVVLRKPEEGKPAKVRLLGSPGLNVVSRPTTSPCIAICHALGTIWSGHADGSIFYGVETPSPSRAGSVAVDPTLPVIRMAEDRTALAIASNRNTRNAALRGTGYVATQATGVVDCGFDASINFDPSTVAELDNFAVWSGASNVYANQDAKMYRSTALSPSQVNPLWFATKEARADRVIDLAISGRVMWPLGARSTEQWYNAGSSADFPFQPFPNSLLSVGLAARQTLATLRDIIGFVGTDKRIWRCAGQSGHAVSPSWIDLLLQMLPPSDLQRLTGYAYGQGGSDFYVLTLPGVWSLELSASTGIWSYRQSPGRFDHAGRCATEHDGGTTYVGTVTGEICTLDLNSSQEPGGTLQRAIITPWVGSQERRSTIDSIDVTSSMGPDAGDFQLEWSTDGTTWRGLRNVTMPKTGERRAIARGFGTERRRQFRLRYGGVKAPFVIDELFAAVTGGS